MASQQKLVKKEKNKAEPERYSDQEEDETCAKTSRRVAVRKRNRQEDQERALRENLTKLANVAITATKKWAEVREKEPPAYLRSFVGYRDLLDRAKTLEAFRRSITSTFAAHHSEIVAEDIDGGWLSEATISIKWTIVPRDVQKVKDFEPYYLDLSKSFRNTLAVVDSVPGGKKVSDIDPNMPELFLFHLYQVFREVVTEKDDKEAIEDTLDALKPKNSVASMLESIDQNSIQSLVGVAMEAIKGFGVDMGDLDPKDVAGKFKNVAKNEKLGQIMSSFTQDLHGCKSPKDVIETLATRTAPGTREKIKEVMGEIKADFAGEEKRIKAELSPAGGAKPKDGDDDGGESEDGDDDEGEAEEVEENDGRGEAKDDSASRKKLARPKS